MRHESYAIDVLDRAGNIIGQKPRRGIDKNSDHYHSVHVIIITPQKQLLLSKIPERANLPTIYSHKLGTTMAVIRRSSENNLDAAHRGLEHKLFISDLPLTELATEMLTLADDRREKTSVFYGTAEQPERFNAVDIESLALMSPRELDACVNDPDRLEYLAATLVTIWERYRAKFPL